MKTIRLLLEGAPRSGASTVLRLLASQVSVSIERWSAVQAAPGAGVEWLTYPTGSPDGSVIRLEVVSTQAAPVGWLVRLRRESDAIVLVVDSREAGVADARNHLDEMALDVFRLDATSRPALALLAHQQDRPNALTGREVADRLNVAPEVTVAATSTTSGGVQYGVALAVRSALRDRAVRDSVMPGRVAAGQLVEVLASLATVE